MLCQEIIVLLHLGMIILIFMTDLYREIIIIWEMYNLLPRIKIIIIRFRLVVSVLLMFF